MSRLSNRIERIPFPMIPGAACIALKIEKAARLLAVEVTEAASGATIWALHVNDGPGLLAQPSDGSHLGISDFRYREHGHWPGLRAYPMLKRGDMVYLSCQDVTQVQLVVEPMLPFVDGESPPRLSRDIENWWGLRQLRQSQEQRRGWHAQRDGHPFRDMASHDWQTGWRTAQAHGPEPGIPVSAYPLCRGVLSPPLHVGPDPEHITPMLEWVCPHCRWRLAGSYDAPTGRPPYVPIHPFYGQNVAGASPMGGLSLVAAMAADGMVLLPNLSARPV